MKKLIHSLPFALLLIFLLGSCHRANLADGTHHFEVYATNDLHGRFFDSLYVSNGSPAVHPYSLASAATEIKQARERIGNENVVLLDIGDHLQGDNAVFYYNFIDTVSGHLFPKVMNYLKYDAVVVGNHDIEPGPRVYNKVKQELAMPYLAANAIDINTREPYFEAYTVLDKNGVKIAVIGLTNPNIPNWLSPHLWPDIEFRAIVTTLEHQVNELREKENVHFVIAAMHAGLGNEDSATLENPARYVAKNVKGIDLVLAAHDHQITAEKYRNGDKEVWLLEGGSRAATLSKAKVELRLKKGQVTGCNINGENIQLAGVEPDAGYIASFNDEFQQVKAFTNRTIGTLNHPIAASEAYFGPSAYVDMIHTLQLEASGADISFAAPLSFDTRIEKGTLNYQHLLEIYPFENQLNVIELSGQEIINYLNFSYAAWINDHPQQNGHLLKLKTDDRSGRVRLQNSGFNFDSAAGIIYEVAINRPKNDRIKVISLADGTNFHPDSTYRVALTSYRASGGGYLLEKGAGIPKTQMENRIVARMSDIRELLYEKLQTDRYIDAKSLGHWKFVPEQLASKLAEKDAKLLFP